MLPTLYGSKTDYASLAQELDKMIDSLKSK